MSCVVEPANSVTTCSDDHKRSRREVAAIFLVTAVAAIGFGWNVQRNQWSNEYYSAAVRSMSSNWHAFRFASVDVGGWVTIDKPPLAFWLQSTSVRVFGFHPWSVMLPSVLLGVSSVCLLTATVRRVAGPVAGCLSGLLLSVTPVMVAMSRSNMPDVTMTFFMVLSAWAAVRGYASSAWRWPVLIGGAAAAGFVTKSLAAGLAVPGIGVGYLLSGNGRWPQRITRAVAAAGAFVALAGLWLLSVDSRPLSSRPWVGGSTNGTAWDLVFGYNLSVFGGEGGLPPGVGRGPGVLGQLFMVFGGERGVGRMFNDGMGDQVMWWFPMAVFGVAVTVAGRSRWKRRDPVVGATVMWMLWAAVGMSVFSFTKGALHPYYVVVFAPALAALAAIGAVRAWEAQGPWRAAAGAALLATAALQVILIRRSPSYRWLGPGLIAVLAAIGSAVVLGRWILRDHVTSLRMWSAVAVSVTLLTAPVLWSLSGIRHQVGGLFPAARPGTDSLSFGPPDSGGPYGFVDFTEDTLRWLDAQRTTETWTVAMASAMVAEDAIIAGHRVVAIGGFSGGDNSASPARVATAVATGRLRYFLVTGGARGLREPDVFTTVSEVCSEVPSSNWGGEGQSGVFDCRNHADALMGSPS